MGVRQRVLLHFYWAGTKKSDQMAKRLRLEMFMPDSAAQTNRTTSKNLFLIFSGLPHILSQNHSAFLFRTLKKIFHNNMWKLYDRHHLYGRFFGWAKNHTNDGDLEYQKNHMEKISFFSLNKNLFLHGSSQKFRHCLSNLTFFFRFLNNFAFDDKKLKFQSLNFKNFRISIRKTSDLAIYFFSFVYLEISV